MDLTSTYEALSAIPAQDLSFWQDFFMKFYRAFIESSRWQQYIEGVGTTLLVTAMALVLGIVLLGNHVCALTRLIGGKRHER